MSKKWLSTVAFSMLSCLMLVSPASADTGIMLEDVDISDAAGKVIRTFEEGERVEFTRKSDSRLTISENYSLHEMNSSAVLPLTRTTEKQWHAKEGAMIYTAPELFSTPIRSVSEGSYLKVLSEKDGWLQVGMKEGLAGWIHLSQAEEKVTEAEVENTTYIQRSLHEEEGPLLFRGDYVRITDYIKGYYTVEREKEEFKVKKADVGDEKPAENERELYEKEQRLNELFAFAEKQLGKPYVWGGNGIPGYDCSGYTKAAFALVGVELPRTAAMQSKVGNPTTLAELKPGDMLFFETYKPGPSHVSIYMGDDLMIHAAGKQVHVSNIHEPYWKSRYLNSRSIDIPVAVK